MPMTSSGRRAADDRMSYGGRRHHGGQLLEAARRIGQLRRARLGALPHPRTFGRVFGEPLQRRRDALGVARLRSPRRSSRRAAPPRRPRPTPRTASPRASLRRSRSRTARLAGSAGSRCRPGRISVRHVLALTEQRNAAARLRGRDQRRERLLIRDLGHLLCPAGNPDPKRDALRHRARRVQQHLVPFPALEPRRHQHDDVAVGDAEGGTTAEPIAEVDVGGRSHRTVNDRARHVGKRGPHLRERAVEHREIRADAARPSIRPCRPRDRLVLPEPDADTAARVDAAANIACGQAPWKITASGASLARIAANSRRARQIINGRDARGDGRRCTDAPASCSSRSRRPPNATTKCCRIRGCGVPAKRDEHALDAAVAIAGGDVKDGGGSRHQK